MKKVLAIVLLLGLVAGTALAAGPKVTSGPPGHQTPISRDDKCQYGFNDDYIGSGYTLGLGQQLGINCFASVPPPRDNQTITGIGYYSEFIVTPGYVTLTVLDNGTVVSQTQEYVTGSGNLDWPIDPVTIPSGHSACIMLCPDNSYWAVTGEDNNSAPYGNSYYSSTCQCSNPFSVVNLTIWADLGQAPNPVETMTWGHIRSLYR